MRCRILIGVYFALILLNGCSTVSGLYRKTFSPSRPPRCHKVYQLSEKENYNVLLFGDGAGSEYQNTVSKGIRKVCQNSGCNFGLYLGDIYPFGIQSNSDFKDKTRDWTFPFLAFWVLGNHEAYGSVQKLIEQAKDTNFKYECETSQIQGKGLTIFTYDSNQIDDKEYRKRIDIQIKSFCQRPGLHILAGHHSAYSDEEEHGNNKEVEAFVQSVGCASYSLSGHSHALEYHEAGGRKYIVSGGAGKEPRAFNNNHRKWGHAGLGFATLETNSEKVVFYDENGFRLWSNKD